MDINNNNHIEQVEQPNYEFLLLPRELDSLTYNKIVKLNSQVSIGDYDPLVQKLKIPVETPVNIEPLLSFFSFDPLDEIVQFNNHLRIETEDKSVLWIRYMAGRPDKQCLEFGSQIRNWNKANNINGSVFGSHTKFKFRVNNALVSYYPDSCFISANRYANIPDSIKNDKGFTIQPDFVVEVRSYGPGANNALIYQQRKMCRWISSGVESGILFDRKGGNAYLYCNTNLVNLANQIAIQQGNVTNETNQLQLDIVDLQNAVENLANFPQAVVLAVQSVLDTKRHKLQQLQWQQVYFQNLVPVPTFDYDGIQQNYPNVLFVAIPLNLAQNAVNGPNIIIHCIGAVDGLRFDLSELPLD
ncbi:hypothetical protein PPL_04946 [Heterostelium album PN500]|uniref:Putative restriction endonuclease domain-containing protein n=1 Tax=Heterostelium pallidum (strain ATCC 26659 / Pp 5 / PN500) TaxID=670386 RepID=D3B902_HETP5|nr:hypothetical protein PPL_04946 [Heterostelium album PN500]EFA82041.1 hypothetical protein PPL_04946 [Heterostelium album PN500]|eukprot:XP_020434158.1 hypothetical protein PPL_04946 [Heterostelium album PN500]